MKNAGHFYYPFHVCFYPATASLEFVNLGKEFFTKWVIQVLLYLGELTHVSSVLLKKENTKIR